MKVSCLSNCCFGPRVIFGPPVLSFALTRTCPPMIIGSNAGLLWFAKFSDGERPQGEHCEGSREMRRQGQQSQRTSRGSWKKLHLLAPFPLVLALLSLGQHRAALLLMCTCRWRRWSPVRSHRHRHRTPTRIMLVPYGRSRLLDTHLSGSDG